jgi:NADPH oxidase
VELRFARKDKSGFNFEAGQFVRVAVNKIGYLQFHTATISSAPYEDYVTVHFRALGNWTQRLLELADHNDEVDIMLEGPYGSVSVDLQDDKLYPMVLCIAGGVGITPMMSIARQLVHEHKNGRRLSHLRVIWSVRDLPMVDVLALTAAPARCCRNKTDIESSGRDTDDTLATNSDSEELTDLVFRRDIYVTRRSDSTAESGDLELTELDTEVNRQTHQMNYYHNKRPDLGAILQETAEEANSQGVARVAVLVCGPVKLTEEVKALCRQQSAASCGGKGGVIFDVHEELFEY